jgi:hypothetical protein
VFLSKQGTSCDGVDISQIVDTTDTQSPQRTVQQRWGNISCLDDKVEAHDGRIRGVFQ